MEPCWRWSTALSWLKALPFCRRS